MSKPRNKLFFLLSAVKKSVSHRFPLILGNQVLLHSILPWACHRSYLYGKADRSKFKTISSPNASFATFVKSVLEADGKIILNYHFIRASVIKSTSLPFFDTHNLFLRFASLYLLEDVAVASILDQAEVTYSWLLIKGVKFVAKPDQLIKRHGKSGLLILNKTWEEARA